MTTRNSSRKNGSNDDNCFEKPAPNRAKSSKKKKTWSQQNRDSNNLKSKSNKSVPNKSGKLQYKFSYWFREDHRSPIFGVQFNQHLPEGQNYFATVGSNRISVYECLNDGSVRLVQCYADTDADESFYTCAWSYDDVTGFPLLAAAGSRGVIRIMSNACQQCIKHFIGHGKLFQMLTRSLMITFSVSQVMPSMISKYILWIPTFCYLSVKITL